MLMAKYITINISISYDEILSRVVPLISGRGHDVSTVCETRHPVFWRVRAYRAERSWRDSGSRCPLRQFFPLGRSSDLNERETVVDKTLWTVVGMVPLSN